MKTNAVVDSVGIANVHTSVMILQIVPLDNIVLPIHALLDAKILLSVLRANIVVKIHAWTLQIVIV
jgi:hypothetical protein